MKAMNRIGNLSIGVPLSADDVVEFHAARLLLLINFCGTSKRIDGLTKMAKLDFFVRYPEFFEKAKHASAPQKDSLKAREGQSDAVVESTMVRHHYGPWDKRYYHVLAHLEAKRLIQVSKVKSYYQIFLTDLGKERAGILAGKAAYRQLIERMAAVKKVFGTKSGTVLKNLIYSIFDEEVAKRPMGEVIQ